VTLAGADEPVARILREEMRLRQGSSSIVGFDLRCSPVDAALINGATSHALDYDDVHPLIVILQPRCCRRCWRSPKQGTLGKDVLRAFIAGYEGRVVGSLVMRSHYERGFTLPLRLARSVRSSAGSCWISMRRRWRLRLVLPAPRRPG